MGYSLLVCRSVTGAKSTRVIEGQEDHVLFGQFRIRCTRQHVAGTAIQIGIHQRLEIPR